MSTRYSLPTLMAGLSLASSLTLATTITDQEQTDLAVTLYTNNLGLVQDTRQLPALTPGQSLAIGDVSREMQIETLQIKNAGTILEQTLNNALLNYHNLLQHYIGKSLTLAKILPNGEELHKSVTLLSIEGDQALVENDQQTESVTLNDQWRFIFPKRPDNLLLKPSLTFRSAGTKEPGTAQISYLTSGLSWQMDYVMTLAPDNTQATLEGLASLSNTTGTDLKNARVKLLAGDINHSHRGGFYSRKEEVMMAAAPQADLNQAPQALNDYQLYSLKDPVTLQNHQTTQVPLLQAEKVKVTPLQRHRLYISHNLDSAVQKIKPDSFIRFVNNKNHGLGQPLPAGQVRFFAPDNKSELQYVGGAHIGQTATGEKVELAMGQAFDMTIEQRQTDYQSAFDGTVVEYELRIRNSAMSKRDVEIEGLFSMPWKLISSSVQPTDTNAGSALWKISVPGNSDALLTLRARLTKPK